MAGVLLAMTVLGFAGSPSAAGPGDVPEGVAPPPPTPLPVTLGSLAALAQAVGWPVVVDTNRNAVRIPVGGENIDFDVFIQPAPATDSRGVQLVTFAVPQVVLVPESHTDKDEVLETLMRMNWYRVIGHWSWDREDGEVRFEYVLMTEGPIQPGEFVGIVERVATSVDDDAPRIYKALSLQEPPATTAGLAIESGETVPGGKTPRMKPSRQPPRPLRDRRDEELPD